MDVLSCKSAAMVRKEIPVYLLAYNLIRLLMTETAHHTGMIARHLSFKHTVQIGLAWQDRDLVAFAHSAEQRAPVSTDGVATCRQSTRSMRTTPSNAERKLTSYSPCRAQLQEPLSGRGRMLQLK
jgi:hypothetical protein